MALSKPSLMNGTQIGEKYTINSRVDSSDAFDVYSLEGDNGYLYVYKDIDKANIINSRKRYEVIFVKTIDGARPAVVDSEFSRKTESRIRQELTELVGLDSVAGMKQLKETLINDVIKPLLYPEKYKKFKLGIPNGILLYGPPGCGKTFIVRKLAEELGYNFIEVKASDVGSSYIHGSVAKISRVFDQAKDTAPSIIFFDEIEGLIPDRDNLGESGSYKQEEINQFLEEINDSGDSNVLVVGATNRPHLIDKAILRSGRMDKRILVPPPDSDARKELFKFCLMGRPVSENINYDLLANKTENFVSSDIELIVESSARMAVKKDYPEINQALIEEVIKTMTPSVSKEEMDYFEGLQVAIDRW
jgi:transitional endoplasmic reticulum ATPase